MQYFLLALLIITALPLPTESAWSVSDETLNMRGDFYSLSDDEYFTNRTTQAGSQSTTLSRDLERG